MVGPFSLADSGVSDGFLGSGNARKSERPSEWLDAGW